MKDIIIKNIVNHLTELGYSNNTAVSCASSAWQHFQKAICNSKDAFKDACDHAGDKAQIREPNIKYKSPKAKSTRRAKKPQEAFKF